MTTVGETAEGQQAAMDKVVNNGPVQISEQDDRKYRHITLENQMQVGARSKVPIVVIARRVSIKLSPMAVIDALGAGCCRCYSMRICFCACQIIRRLLSIQGTEALWAISAACRHSSFGLDIPPQKFDFEVGRKMGKQRTTIAVTAVGRFPLSTLSDTLVFGIHWTS